MTNNNKQTSISTRSRLVSIAAACCLAFTPALHAQEAPMSLNTLNAFELRVSNPTRTIAFYQDMFGLPVLSRVGNMTSLGIGDNGGVMMVRPLMAGEEPGISWLGYSIENFNLQQEQAKLQALGFRVIDAPARSVPGIENAMSTWVRMRGDTPELFFADKRGLIVHLSDPSWCGGAGALGNNCGASESAPAGMFSVKDINHFTAFVNDGAEANTWYQDTFGLEVQSYQGPGAPVTGIGDGYQFVMYAGGPSGNPVPANIHHGSFNLHAFDVEGIQNKLEAYGFSEQGDRPLGPMMHYISLRQPERGGAPGGTPELYFTDPDGIRMQMQDPTYCGGGGYLGSECLAD
jgi:catechol 2,3-dioxygenase-like lactoylglutathione lyase family enzyme